MERNIVRNKHFIVQLMRTNYKILRLLKIVKIIKAAATRCGSHITITREPHPVLSYNYISGTNVPILMLSDLWRHIPP